MKPVKRSKAFLFIPFFFLILFVFGCEGRTVDEETAVKIYVENIIAEQKHFASPDSLEYFRNEIFVKYNSSKKEFDHYLKNIEGEPEKWESFFKKADLYLNELKKNGKIK